MPALAPRISALAAATVLAAAASFSAIGPAHAGACRAQDDLLVRSDRPFAGSGAQRREARRFKGDTAASDTAAERGASRGSADDAFDQAVPASGGLASEARGLFRIDAASSWFPSPAGPAARTPLFGGFTQ